MSTQFQRIENENNIATFIGTMVSDFSIHHTTKNQNFYTFDLRVKRLSDNYDIIPIIVSESYYNCIDPDVKPGSRLYCNGEVRTYNESYVDSNGNTKYHVKVFVYAYEITNNISEEFNDTNFVHLNGHLCKDPVLRTTPNGRSITDLVVAVGRNSSVRNKSDYIPTIAWGTNAISASNISKGDGVSIRGRFQSRTYNKKIGENQTMLKISYEVSVDDIEVNTDFSNNWSVKTH